MSFITMRNGLVATIVAGGKWAACEVSTCDLGIMNSSGSCVFIQPGGATVVGAMAFGNPSREKKVTREFFGRVFVKDTGAPCKLLGDLWTAADDLFASINADDSLSGMAEAAMVVSFGRPAIDSFVTDGSIDWSYIDFTVRGEEYL
jgi:hypothetical protein